MKNKLIKFVGLISPLILHAGFVAVVIYFVWPILVLYFNQKPAVGIDLFLSVDFVTYIRDHFNWPFSSWRYNWYGGMPLTQTYPLLHFYLIQPLLHWFSAVQAIQVYVLASMVLFCIFSYLFFYSLSKSRGLSVVLAVATAYSYNLWSALYWAGSIPYTATMFLLPFSLYMVVQAFERGNKKYIYFAGLLSGIFILGHPQSFIAYTVPLAAILILFFGSKKVKMFAWEKLGVVFIYGLIILFVGFPKAGIGLEVLGQLTNVVMSAFTKGAEQITQSYIAEAAKETAGSPFARMFDVVRRTNPLFFWTVGFGLIFAFLTLLPTLLIRRMISHYSKLLFPIVLMFVYMFLFLYSFVMGINPLTGGWFRAFWPSMTIFGAVVAVTWRIATDNLEIIIGGWGDKPYIIRRLGWVFGGISSLAILFVGISFLQSTYRAFEKEMLGYVSESSNFPTALALNLKKGEWPEKLPKLVPDWMDPNDITYRYYNMDATVNIWWGSVYKMPLARGYLDAAPKGSSGENYGGWQYWQNITLTKNEVVERWDVSEELAKQQSKFLLDWHAIRFMEAAPTYGRNYTSLPSSYIIEDPEILDKTESVEVFRPGKYFQIEGRGWDIPDNYQKLTYFAIKKEVISPIYNASNAPSILVIGDRIGQDTMMRDFAFLNLNSKKAIIVQWDRPVDDLTSDQLKNFDVVVLYRYKYKNSRRAFSRLEKYVKEGGNLFIDTGSEQKEAIYSNLPAVFPFAGSDRKPLGKEWGWQVQEHKVTKDIDFNQFGEPIYNDQGWSFSYPVGELRNGATVLVSNHQKPILIAYGLGQGKVIWSGMNFPGHLLRYKKIDEVKLFKNILFYFKDFSTDKNIQVAYSRPSSEKVIIKGSGAKAILFKEAAYPGWTLTVKSNNQRKQLPIYQAGPMVYGYMYAVLPENMRNASFEATFEYHGELVYKIVYLISALAVIIVLDYLFIGAKLTRLFSRITKPLHGKVWEWWEKEEEY